MRRPESLRRTHRRSATAGKGMPRYGAGGGGPPPIIMSFSHPPPPPYPSATISGQPFSGNFTTVDNHSVPVSDRGDPPPTEAPPIGPIYFLKGGGGTPYPPPPQPVWGPVSQQAGWGFQWTLRRRSNFRLSRKRRQGGGGTPSPHPCRGYTSPPSTYPPRLRFIF